MSASTQVIPPQSSHALHVEASNQVDPICSIDTEHNDMIHDIQLDYYGKRLVTCSADRTFRVYDVTNSTASAPPSTSSANNELHILTHIVPLPETTAAPIYRIAWAHPKYGSVLAVACQDGKVYIYREELSPNGSGQTQWHQKHVHTFHQAAILCIAWAPYEYGLCLASASADGKVSFLTRVREGWVLSSSITNTEDGVACTSVSWAPYNSLGSQGTQGPIQRIVSGSRNSVVQLFSFDPQMSSWTLLETLCGHTDWVRDVVWSPNVGIPCNVIASGSDDQTVRVWAQDDKDGEWKMHILSSFSSPVYRLHWSLTGSVLSVAAGDNEISFWKQKNEKEWTQISSINASGTRNFE
uniref:WD domaincontaining protein putative n=1 Tax=Albugo laibachii Nc14 TaxID=890382 RepID=F0W337_9STRA|nr:WD domaincontaining protein putative [Albugo laibachii Nc14]|eukprot:CCA15477.1 WD domaincontaining protein putative [Albugo laibachii Nc14]